MAQHNDFGKMGEEMALKLLKSKGYEILEINWRQGKLEIDIIAQHQNVIVIAEVKTRSSAEFGAPEFFVDRKKQRLLIKAANEFVNQKSLEGEIRFDIISIVFYNGEAKIEHLTDAFFPTLN